MPETLSKEEKHVKIEAAKKDLIHEFLTHEPKNWRLAPSVALKDYAEAWANDILPIAREAHEASNSRTSLRNRWMTARSSPSDRRRKEIGRRRLLLRLVGADVREELPKAGWRLADLLEQA